MDHAFFPGKSAAMRFASKLAAPLRASLRHSLRVPAVAPVRVPVLVPVLLPVLLVVLGGTAPAFAKSAPAVTVFDSAAVAVADRYGAQAATEVLKAGGNAVDAAVAVGFALAVTYPEAGNIGGGGFMTMYVDNQPYFLDFRERAPGGSTRDMYLDEKGNVVPDASLIGAKAVAVPGTVAGLWEAQKKFGKLKWAQVLAPSIALARNGFPVDKQLAERIATASKRFAGKTNFDVYFGHLRAGDTLRQPELAETLQRIADNGGSEFYSGRTGGLLASAMYGHGLVTQDDLNSYKAVWRQPIVAPWHGYQIITAPPPSSGGIALVQLLRMREDLGDTFNGVPVNSAKYVHLTAEMEKRVFADRAAYLGDPDFYKVPVAQLTAPDYLARRAKEVDIDKPSDTASIKPGLGKLDANGGPSSERPETTHYSVVDKWGNAVSTTYTLNGRFGSGMVVPGGGFLLNDEMDDFSAKPGAANMFGVVGGDANAIAAGKRPLSSMTPTILTDAGKVALVIGTPGGSRIFTTLYQVIADVVYANMPLDQAVAMQRFHHQLLPANTIYWEPYAPVDSALRAQLEGMGYKMATQDFNGDVQAIEIRGNTPMPVADPRGRGVTAVIR